MVFKAADKGRNVVIARKIYEAEALCQWKDHACSKINSF